MSEKKLQHQIVLSHNNLRPEEYGLLWMIRNETKSLKDAIKMRSLGQIAGASDLVYFKDNRFIAFEVKEKGSRHNADHVRRQLNWGKKIEAQGGRWFIVLSVEAFWCALNNELSKELLTTVQVEKMLENGSKTLLF